jgi:L-2-hydroxyglutarate oxidase LhgO
VLHFETVIIGAGLIGLGVAERLSREGRTVLLLEERERPAQVTSSRNSQVLHAGLYYPPGSLKARLCLRGNASLAQWCQGHAVPLRRVGKLIVATAAEDEGALQGLLEQARANGVPGIQSVDAQFVEQLEPELRATAALWSPSTGILDVHAFAQSLWTAAVEQGATVALRHRFVHGARAGAGYRVRLVDPQGEAVNVECRCVVNAAGLHADTVAACFGLDVDALGYRQHWVKGRYFRVRAPGRVTHLVYPVPLSGLAGLGIHVTVGLDGEVKLGPDVELLSQRVEDYAVPEEAAERFFAGAVRYLPWLTRELLSADQAGIRPKLSRPGEPARDFVIAQESARGLPGLITLAGMESPGLTATLEIANEVHALLS